MVDMKKIVLTLGFVYTIIRGVGQMIKLTDCPGDDMNESREDYYKSVGESKIDVPEYLLKIASFVRDLRLSELNFEKNIIYKDEVFRFSIGVLREVDEEGNINEIDEIID